MGRPRRRAEQPERPQDILDVVEVVLEPRLERLGTFDGSRSSMMPKTCSRSS